jgi:hypothetical protein
VCLGRPCGGYVPGMSDTGPDDAPDTAVHPQQPAEGDREEVDRALARDAAETPGDEPGGDTDADVN